jgi:hypothetical protein
MQTKQVDLPTNHASKKITIKNGQERYDDNTAENKIMNTTVLQRSGNVFAIPVSPSSAPFVILNV